MIRDLFRPPDERTVDRLVRLHARDANDHQRAMFRASLCAALSPDELRQLVSSLPMPGAQVVIDSDRHTSIQMAGAGERQKHGASDRHWP